MVAWFHGAVPRTEQEQKGQIGVGVGWGEVGGGVGWRGEVRVGSFGVSWAGGEGGHVGVVARVSKRSPHSTPAKNPIL